MLDSVLVYFVLNLTFFQLQSGRTSDGLQSGRTSDALNQAAVAAVRGDSGAVAPRTSSQDTFTIAGSLHCRLHTVWMVTLSSISKPACFLQSCAQFPFSRLKGLLTKQVSHSVSFSSPIAFVPHRRSLLPSAKLCDRPYSAGCKSPLTTASSLHCHLHTYSLDGNTFINFQAHTWSPACFYKVVHNFHSRV